MINVELINMWELLRKLWTGTAVTEFNQILFKANEKTFEFIQADFNKKISLTDEKSE